MKKIVYILIGLLLFTNVAIAENNRTEDGEIKLRDINSHWAKEYIEKLITLGSIEGYPDGSFKPENTITNAEFTKILLASKGQHFENSKDGHWAKDYIEKAKGLSIIDEGDFKDLDKPITRGQMAKMIVMTTNDRVSNLNIYEKQIKDIEGMPIDIQFYVATAYGLGIITGYEDGSFKNEKTATRAEASTMIIRMLDEKERKIPKIREDGRWTHKQFLDFTKTNKAHSTLSLGYFEVVEDGKLRFKRSHYGVKEDTILDESKFPNLNRIIYDVVKDLGQLAYEGGHYVEVFYNPVEGLDSVVIDFYEEERIAKGGKVLKGEFGVSLQVEPQKYYEDTKDLSYVSVNVSKFWRMKDIVNKGVQFIEDSNNRHPDFLRGFRDMLYNIYGEEDGKLIYEYALQEYDKEYETKGKRRNHSLVNIGNIEAKNNNWEGIGLRFTTNIKK